MRLIRPVIAVTVLAGILTAAAAVPATAGSVTAGSVTAGSGHAGSRAGLETGRGGSADVGVPADTDVAPEAGSVAYTNWAGWAEQAGTSVELRYVYAQFKVPKVSCGAEGRDASFWVGLDGFKSPSNTVEQAGVVAECNVEGPNGVVPNYYTFYEMYPNGSDGRSGVSAGDTITASAYYNSDTGEYELAVSDNNNSAADISVTKSCPSGYTCRNSSAEVIAEDPNGGPREKAYLANFGTVNFSHAAVTSRDGTHGTLEGNSLWAAYEVTMEYPSSTVMAQPSDRTDSGTAFSATYKSDG